MQKIDKNSFARYGYIQVYSINDNDREGYKFKILNKDKSTKQGSSWGTILLSSESSLSALSSTEFKITSLGNDNWYFSKDQSHELFAVGTKN